jgi:uncharacterized protein
MVGILSFHLHLPGCASLKEKRGRLKPLLARLHKEFNVSAAEMDLLDKWHESIIACAMVGNDKNHLQRSLQTVANWVAQNWLDITVVDYHIELL